MKLEGLDPMKNKAWLVYVLASLFFLGIYYSLSIPASPFFLDQYKLIEYSKEILAGNFRWVGMRTSRLSWNFAMIHYLLTPLVALTEDIIRLYASTAISYLIGMYLIAWMLLQYRNFSEFICFALLSMTHVWSLFFSTFIWPPNYIPFFSSLFLIFFIQYLKNSQKVIYFYLSALFLNILLQLHPLSIVLGLGFVLTLIVLGKLPRYRHWILQIMIQLLLISPWLIYHRFIIDWSKEPKYHAALFRNFTSAPEEFFNYLSGVGLIHEYTLYLDYGTNTFPYEAFFDWILSGGGVLFLFLLCWTLFQQHPVLKSRNFKWRKTLHYLRPYYQEETDFHKSYVIMLYLLFMPTLLYFFSGITMFAHYYEFLTPLLFLMLASLSTQLMHSEMRKFALLGIAGVSMIQGTFSYWRAWDKHTNPYLHDVAYTPKLAEIVERQCKDNPQIFFISRYGVQNNRAMFAYRYEAERSKTQKTGNLQCDSLIVFQNKLLRQSPVIQWHLQSLKPLNKLQIKNNQIWIMGGNE